MTYSILRVYIFEVSPLKNISFLCPGNIFSTIVNKENCRDNIVLIILKIYIKWKDGGSLFL